MKKKFLLPFLIIPLIITGCSGNKNKGNAPSDPNDYEKWINTWSESGHVYMHYLRSNAKEAKDYKDWGMWVWPNAPQDLEGSLWGAGNSAHTATVPYAMTTSIMTNVGGSGSDVDDYGAIYDIDLTRTDIIGGKTGEPVSFSGATKVGFLVANLTSMDGSSHWVSDGGKNLYIEDFQSHWRENGSMHIFLVQGDCSNFRFYAGGDSETNPTINDTTGDYRSEEVHIADTYPVNYGQASPINTSTAFKSHGVGYQIFVASFRDSDGDGMGDIQGVIDSLDYLKNDLNVDTLWLTPVQKCESYHGYDTVDYYHIDPRFGTDAKYQELLDAAHDRGMFVLMDLVINHTSKNNIWYNLSQKASVSYDEVSKQTINWRNIYHWKFKGDEVLAYDKSTGQYNSIKVENHPDWYKDGESNYYYYGKFGSGMPELNYDNAETRSLVKNLAKYWLDKGVDGFRLDAVKHIYMKDEIRPDDPDTQNDILVADYGTKEYFDEQLRERVTKTFDYSSDVTRNVEFWKEFSGDIKKDYPDCFLVGENFDGYGSRMAPYYQAFDSQFDFSNFFHIDEWLFRTSTELDKDGNPGKANTIGPSIYAQEQIKDAYAVYKSNNNDADLWEDLDGNPSTPAIHTRDHNYPTGHRSDFINGAFTSNHDTLRAINHANIMSRKEVVVNHYQDEQGQPIIQNYQTSKVTGTAQEIGRAKVAAALTILNPGLSWIYYGDELGMSSNTDIHYEKYYNENNEDLWYRQPYKWQNESIIPGYKFNGYTVEWDSYNSTINDMETQKTTDGSMLKYYMGLTTIKKLFGSNINYVNPGWSNQDVVTWQVGAYTIAVNTTDHNTPYDGATENRLVNAATGYTETYSGVIPPYSVLVRK